jgi:hypothetical protein
LSLVTCCFGGLLDAAGGLNCFLRQRNGRKKKEWK